MKKVLRYIWQLPQNLIGSLVVAFTKADYHVGVQVWDTDYNFGVCLGDYIIVNRYCTMKTINHEKGHQKQSLYLGWLYLFTVGILSASGNLIDRWFHKKWTTERRLKWYYSLPWEAWADKLGGVKRYAEL